MEMNPMPSLLYILLLSLGKLLGYRDGLYSTEDDDVTVLNSETFLTSVTNRRPGVAWMVEFYNSWCGHCMNFAPTWKRLATDFASWRDVFVVGAIDCSQSVNLETCRENDITAYPTMKIFPPVDSPGGKVQKVMSQKLEAIKGQIFEFLNNHASESWPYLKPLMKLDDAWLHKRDHHQDVLVIFEEDLSFIGIQVIMDLRNVSNALVLRMLKGNSASLEVHKFPSLYKVEPESRIVLLTIGSKNPAEDRLAFVHTVQAVSRNTGRQLEPQFQLNEELEDNIPGSEYSWTRVDMFNNSAAVVSMHDLESALHYSLRQEVAQKNFIEGEAFQALQNFVKVLATYFPGRKPVRAFLDRVSRLLDQSSSHRGNKWVHEINLLQDEDHFLPSHIMWHACQGSHPGYRGYPCSLWKLFHTLTMEAFQQNKRTNTGHPRDVLLAIRDYVQHFFGCQECSSNFVWIARSIDSEVFSHSDSVLWLWKAHNRANIRLHGDVSEDPQFPKIEYPSDKMCPDCRRLIPFDEGMKYTWDKDKVLQFLVGVYGGEHIILPGSLKSFKSDKNTPDFSVSIHSAGLNLSKSTVNRSGRKHRPRLAVEARKQKLIPAGWTTSQSWQRHLPSKPAKSHNKTSSQLWQLLGMSHLDVSLCLLSYLLSAVVLFILYHFLIVRRRRLLNKSGKPWFSSSA